MTKDERNALIEKTLEAVREALVATDELIGGLDRDSDRYDDEVNAITEARDAALWEFDQHLWYHEAPAIREARLEKLR